MNREIKFDEISYPKSFFFGSIYEISHFLVSRPHFSSYVTSTDSPPIFQFTEICSENHKVRKKFFFDESGFLTLIETEDGINETFFDELISNDVNLIFLHRNGYYSKDEFRAKRYSSQTTEFCVSNWHFPLSFKAYEMTAPFSENWYCGTFTRTSIDELLIEISSLSCQSNGNESNEQIFIITDLEFQIKEIKFVGDWKWQLINQKLQIEKGDFESIPDSIIYKFNYNTFKDLETISVYQDLKPIKIFSFDYFEGRLLKSISLNSESYNINQDFIYENFDSFGNWRTKKVFINETHVCNYFRDYYYYSNSKQPISLNKIVDLNYWPIKENPLKNFYDQEHSLRSLNRRNEF